MTKSELITSIAKRRTNLPFVDVELAVNTIIENITSALSNGKRIEIRGFGVFRLRYRPAKIGRNPKTGESVSLPGKYVPTFKAGKELLRQVKDKYKS